MAVLGDSYVAAEGVSTEWTLTAQLEEMLNAAATGPRWEVMNFGITGSSTGQQLTLYREVVSKFRPDVVVVAFGTGSDVTDNSRELSSSLIERFELDTNGNLCRVPPSKSRAGLSRVLGRVSRFYEWQQDKWRAIASRYRTTRLTNRQRIYSSAESQKFQRAWQLTAAILRELDKEAAAQGARLFVTPIPTSEQVYVDRLKVIKALADDPSAIDCEHPCRQLAAICKDLHIPFCSMVKEFRHRAPTGLSTVEGEQLFFHGYGHLNRPGHLAAAECIARILVTTSRLESVVPSSRVFPAAMTASLPQKVECASKK